MIKKNMFVSFEPDNDKFIASLTIDGLISMEDDPEITLNKAADIYQRSITKMRLLVKSINELRSHHKLVPARTIWQLGNLIFELVEDLGKLSLEIDGIYIHLVRELDVKRKWLEKVIIFRRYLPKQETIPESLNWGRCEKGTRKVAEKLQKGLPLG